MTIITKCTHDRNDPDNGYWSLTPDGGNRYRCRPCQNRHSKASYDRMKASGYRKAGKVAPVSAPVDFPVVDLADYRPIPPAGVYLIPNEIRPTLMTVAADYDEAKRISDLAAVLDLIRRRNLPADETAELVSMLTETR